MYNEGYVHLKYAFCNLAFHPSDPTEIQKATLQYLNCSVLPLQAVSVRLSILHLA